MSIVPFDAKQRSRTGAAWLLAAFLFVLPFSSSIVARNLFLGLAAACLLFAAVAGPKGAGGQLPRPRVLLPIACWSLWCVASVAWSIEPDYSVSELRPGLLYPAIAFLVFHAATADSTDIDRWAWSLSAGLALLGLAAVVSMLAIGEWDPQRWHGGNGSFSAHVVLATPLLAWAFLRAPREAIVARVMLASTVALTFAALFWTDNRISWIALVAMTALGALLLGRLPGGLPSRRRHVLAAALSAAFLVLFSFTLENRSPSQQEDPVEAARELSEDPRIALWRFSFQRIADSPWVGHGYGMRILRTPFRTSVKPYNKLNLHAHNVLLNVTLQTGLVGLALFTWMVAALLLEMAAGLRAEPPRNLVATLGVVLVAGFAVRNMTDDFLVRHNAMLAWSLAGAVLGALRPGPQPTCARRRA